MRGLAALALALAVVAGCSLVPNTLGGREKCWPETDRRAPSLWRGILEIDGSGARLRTPEGELIPLLPGAIRVAGRQVVRDTTVVATAGDDITIFGGAGGDGGLVMCTVEEIHSRASAGHQRASASSSSIAPSRRR
jgi:hypothetical protein